MAGENAEEYYQRRVRLLAEHRARRQEWDWLARRLPEAEIVDDLGRGWRSLVVELHRALVELDSDYRLYEACQDFGGLVFDARLTPARAVAGARLISAARARAYAICEICGAGGILRAERLQMRTLCDACWESDRALARAHGERHADVVLTRLLSADNDHPSVVETLAWLVELDG